jgi:YHS domain-containing protein
LKETCRAHRIGSLRIYNKSTPRVVQFINRKELYKPMVTDPVCGMEIDPKTAAGKSDYQGQTYYFCSLGCKKAFDKDPQKYLKGESGHSGHHH